MYVECNGKTLQNAYKMAKDKNYSIYLVAEDQAGYFSVKQAEKEGIPRQRLYDLVQRGEIINADRGIYRLVKFPASRFEDLHIASLRTGPDSVISYDSALAVYDLSDVIYTKPHVIIPRTGSLRRKGIQLHTNRLEEEEITEREGLKITTVERTIADVIVSGISHQHARQAIEEALQRGLTTEKKLLAYAKKRRGIAEKKINQIVREMKK